MYLVVNSTLFLMHVCTCSVTVFLLNSQIDHTTTMMKGNTLYSRETKTYRSKPLKSVCRLDFQNFGSRVTAWFICRESIKKKTH